MLALSTCWSSARHTDGAAMLQEIRDLGFNYVELGHGTRISLAEGILKVIEKNVIRVCSVHNFCPLPIGFFDAAPNIYQFSSRDESEWKNAIRHTRNSIDFAARVGAHVVVIHAGKVPMRNTTRQLLDVYSQADQSASKYQQTLQKAIKERTRNQRRYFSQTIKSLLDLVSYAADKNVKLGVETRYELEAIPDETEMTEILRTFPGNTVGYWHDCGHAQVRQNLGIGTNHDWLEKFSKRLIGFHLHDTIAPGSDHLAPGDGAIDFSEIAPFFSDKIPMVMELNPLVPPERVCAGLELIKTLIQNSDKQEQPHTLRTAQESTN